MKLSLLALAVLTLAGCGGTSALPTFPTGANAQIGVTAPTPCSTPNLTFPQVTRPARIYLNPASCPSASRFVLYDDGSFELQYVWSQGSPSYGGTYMEKDGRITFTWQGWSTAGPWGADGTITPTTLSVHFNLVMQMSDFADADYTRVP